MDISHNVSRTMTKEETAFYVKLGKRLTRARQEQGMSQIQLGVAVDFSQQTIAAFEKGCRRVPVSALLAIADILGVTINELVGIPTVKPGKRGPAPKLQQQLERLSRLPKQKQKFVSDMLDTVLKQAS